MLVAVVITFAICFFPVHLLSILRCVFAILLCTIFVEKYFKYSKKFINFNKKITCMFNS